MPQLKESDSMNPECPKCSTAIASLDPYEGSDDLRDSPVIASPCGHIFDMDEAMAFTLEPTAH